MPRRCAASGKEGKQRGQTLNRQHDQAVSKGSPGVGEWVVATLKMLWMTTFALQH
jgi:hypothetical protein